MARWLQVSLVQFEGRFALVSWVSRFSENNI